jgi:hypothetical protein
MQVVGVTTQQELYIASRERKFVINEILVVEDQGRHNPRVEVVATQSFNRYIPLTTERNGLVDEKVLAGLQAVGYNVQEEELNLARARVIGEISTPVVVGSKVRRPAFSEVSQLLVRVSPAEGLVLGTIRGTENLVDELPEDLADVLCLCSPGGSVTSQEGVPFIFDYRSMDQYPHIGVFGGSGSGKSFGLRVLLEELMIKKIPGIALDPHYEMDFSVPFPGLPGQHYLDCPDRYRVFTVGVDVGVNFEELTSAELVALLGTGEPLSEAMAGAVFTIHKRKDSLQSFSDNVKDLINAMEDPRLTRTEPGGRRDPLEAQKAERYRDLSERYGTRVGGAGTLRGISWRLNALAEQGLFTAGTAAVEQAVLGRKLAIIRGPVRLLQTYAAYLFRRLYHQRRNYRDAVKRQDQAPEEWFPPFVIITDEAHNFALRGDREPASKRIIREIAQEGRKYGVNLILASQRPALLDDTVNAQLNTKLIFRTVRAADIAVIKDETDLGPEETGRLPYLNSGNAFISSAITGRSIPVRIRCTRTASPHSQNPFDELVEQSRAGDDKFRRVIKEHLPFPTFNAELHLTAIQEKLGAKISFNEILEKMRMLAAEGLLQVEKTPFGEQYILKEKSDEH